MVNTFIGGVTRANVLELLKHKNAEQNLKCLDWLSATTYADKQFGNIKLHQPGTREWFLKSPEFQTWIEGSEQTLLCTGIPGAGKTILASIAIDELESRHGNNPDIGIAYIYCSFQRHEDQSQTLESLLGCLLRQLIQGLQPVPNSIQALYDKHRMKGTRPKYGELSGVFSSIFCLFSQCFIVVDALDECDFVTISRLLDDILDFQWLTKLNLLATSRFIPEIVTKFHGKPSQEIRAARPDVTRYLNANLNRFLGFVSRDLQLQQEITTGITDAIDGMFLLAKLHLEAMMGKISARQIRRELAELTTGSHAYDLAYEKAMQRIEGQAPDQRLLASNVLSWIALCKTAVEDIGATACHCCRAW